MISSHLSDETVAAFADGVLHGHARNRAARHLDSCEHCQQAVRVQRETVLALRRAPAPPLPAGLFERLRGLPGEDDAVLPAPALEGAPRFALGAPVAAFATPRASRPEPADAAPDTSAEPTDGPAPEVYPGPAALFPGRGRRRP